MTVVIIVLLVLILVAFGALLWLLRGLLARQRAIAQQLLELVPAEALPVPLDDQFAAGGRRLLVIDILNPLELAASQVKIAGPAGAVAPGLIRKVVYDQAVKITQTELAKQGVQADVQVYVAR
jgi:hypothetical protein